MNNNLRVVVLCGGVSNEREISLVSGNTVYEALKGSLSVEKEDVFSRSIPEGLDRVNDIIFPLFHGEFGEDGKFQAMLDEGGFEYVGSGAISSALCMDKDQAKVTVAEAGVPCMDHVWFDAEEKPDFDQVIENLGEDLIIKPNNGGSTLGFQFMEGREAIERILSELNQGEWLIEQRVRGREFSVGILNGTAMGVVEIKPKNGKVYDFKSKYTPGETAYEFPAAIGEELTSKIQRFGEIAFEVCGCRDYARVDFMYSEEEGLVFLEVNTIPGFTVAGLFPKSASCVGFDIKSLCAELIKPAIKRHKERAEVVHV